MLQQNPRLVEAEVAWLQPTVLVFAGTSLQTASEFQRCAGGGGHSVWIGSYGHSHLFFFQIHCFLTPESNRSPCCLCGRAGQVSLSQARVCGGVGPGVAVGPCCPHWNVTSPSYFLASLHGKRQLVAQPLTDLTETCPGWAKSLPW